LGYALCIYGIHLIYTILWCAGLQLVFVIAAGASVTVRLHRGARYQLNIASPGMPDLIEPSFCTSMVTA
jgi:hypothetical protein